MVDSLARKLDLNDFWDRRMFYVMGVGLGCIEINFWRDINPVNMVVVQIWHYREIWRAFHNIRKPAIRE